MYGLDPLDFEAIDKKLDFQKAFIENKFFDFDIAENKSALEFTYSANLNPNKYFAEMNNRINSIFQYSKNLDLMPVFCTITAPSKYHQTDKNRKLIYSPNYTAKALTQIFNKFTNLQVFQRMKRETNHGLIYFRVYEPHKSGVPHCHIMLFLPKNYILEVKKKFFEYFTNAEKWGNNKKSLDFRYTFYNVNGAIAYIMKYVTKTFKNENDTTNKAWYWYIKNRIRRFLTSRTLAPLEIYRKVRYFFKNIPDDYLYVTKLIKNNQIIKLFEKTTFNYMRFNLETGDVEDVTLWQKSAELILNSRIKTNQTFTLKYTPRLHNKALTVFVSEFVKYSFSDKLNKFVILPVVPAMLKDYQLNKYYDLLIKDLDNIDLVHFGVVKNEMIKRGFLYEIQDVYINPKLYNSDFLTVD